MDIPSRPRRRSRRDRGRKSCWQTRGCLRRDATSEHDGLAESQCLRGLGWRRSIRGAPALCRDIEWPRSPVCNFQQILVNLGSIGPTIESTSDLVPTRFASTREYQPCSNSWLEDPQSATTAVILIDVNKFLTSNAELHAVGVQKHSRSCTYSSGLAEERRTGRIRCSNDLSCHLLASSNEHRWECADTHQSSSTHKSPPQSWTQPQSILTECGHHILNRSTQPTSLDDRILISASSILHLRIDRRSRVESVRGI